MDISQTPNPERDPDIVRFELRCREVREQGYAMSREATNAWAGEAMRMHQRDAWRADDARREFWLKVRWMLFGSVLGVLLMLGYMQVIHG
jgi:hypothetical protein